MEVPTPSTDTDLSSEQEVTPAAPMADINEDRLREFWNTSYEPYRGDDAPTTR